jgi:predicted Rossmann-fold nucleotide-binding protein
MRVLVCGGRDYDEWKSVARALVELKPTVVIQGGASGADRLAARWADINGVPIVTYPALWKQGKKAGPMRNAFMLQDGRPDIVLAFPGGRGTDGMVKLAEDAGVPVRRI